MSKFCPVDLPPCSNEESIIDFEVRIDEGEWVAWKKRVP